VWSLVDVMGRDHARVPIVRVGSEVGYVDEFGEYLLGRYRTLRACAEAVHTAFV